MLGLVEGIAEATAQITRVFSGWLSDLLNRRKALTVVGYGLAAATKPLFPLATSVGTVSIRDLPIVSARGFVARRAMPWSPISRPSTKGARSSACVRRSTLWAPFSDR